MSDLILDASALLALINEEPGAEVVEAAITHSAISAVNLSEVVTKLDEGGMSQEVIRQALELGIEVLPFDHEQAYLAGLLRSKTRLFGLSLGEGLRPAFGQRACLALAFKLNLPVLTTDRTWEKVELNVQIQVIR